MRVDVRRRAAPYDAGVTSSTRREPEALAGRVGGLDTDAQDAARQHLQHLLAPGETVGRLGELAVWLAGAQATFPPVQPRRPTLLVLGAGQASARDALERVGLRVRALEPSTRSAPDPDPDPTGDRAIAMSIDAARSAFELGVVAVDAEVDAGADLLALAGGTPDGQEAAAGAVAVLAGSDLGDLLGDGPGLDDEAWRQRAERVRDAVFRARDRRQGLDLVAALGQPELGVAVGVVLASAARRTPVLLEGLSAAAGALLAQRLAFRSIRWCQASTAARDPAHTAAWDRLGLDPVLAIALDSGSGSTAGLGAAMALPLLRTAVDVLATPAGAVGAAEAGGAAMGSRPARTADA